MAKQKQEGEPELTQSILDFDYTPSHIAELLSAQTNDQERYTLAEKLILDLINKNNERTELLNERIALCLVVGALIPGGTDGGGCDRGRHLDSSQYGLGSEKG